MILLNTQTSGGSWDLVTRVISKVAVHQHIISTYNPNHGTYNRT